MAKASAAAATRRLKPLLNQKLSALSPLTADDATALLDLKTGSRSVRPGQEIVSEGRRCTAVFMVAEGIAIRYRILRDGQRQILNFVLPGDFAGVNSCFFENALFSTKTLTHTVITPIPRAKLIGLFDTHPGLAARLFRLFARDSAICAEHLIAVGRRSAAERIAHFLLELLTRLQAKGLAEGCSYRLPLTQEMISDALGLSIPYVNRVLHRLRDDGLVRIRDQTVVIENMEELLALADFEHNYLQPLPIVELLGEHV